MALRGVKERAGATPASGRLICPDLYASALKGSAGVAPAQSLTLYRISPGAWRKACREDVANIVANLSQRSVQLLQAVQQAMRFPFGDEQSEILGTEIFPDVC